MRSLLRATGPGDVRDALALAAAVLVVGASFGALAAAAGVPVPLIVAMSALVFAGGAQFLVVAVVAAGGSPVAAVAAALLLNVRHLPFGLAVGGTVGSGWAARLVGAHLLVDETVAFSRARPTPERARAAYWLTGTLLFVVWQLGTVVGLVAGSAVPDPDAFGVDAAFPAGLLALLLPALRRRDARRVAPAAAGAALLTTPLLPAGLPVLAGLLGLLAAGRAPAPPAAVSGAGGGGPDGGGPDGGGPDSGGTDSGGPDSGGPDSGGPDSGATDSGGPDGCGPGAGGAATGGAAGEQPR